MRIHFQNSTRPKKAAKAIARATGRPLALCQQVLAKACGYRDWHDIENSFSSINEPPNFNIVDMQVALVMKLVRSLDTNAGDVQYALAASRLFGNRPANVLEAIEVRRRLLEENELPPMGRRERGTIGKLKTAGRNGEHVILREYGRPTRVITHKSADEIVANFEYVSPKQAIPLFIPMRLYLPYGVWTEADGAKVLFSRDYMPLWRLRDGHAPERIFPWLRIKHIEQSWFWGDENTPWSKPETYKREIVRLEAFGIRSLPLLVEALPLIVQRDDIRDFKDAVPIMEELHTQQSA